MEVQIKMTIWDKDNKKVKYFNSSYDIITEDEIQELYYQKFKNGELNLPMHIDIDDVGKVNFNVEKITV